MNFWRFAKAPTTLPPPTGDTNVRYARSFSRGSLCGASERETRLALGQHVFANLGHNREVGIDHVGNFVFRRLAHECLRAALGVAVISHQQLLQFGGGVLE